MTRSRRGGRSAPPGCPGRRRRPGFARARFRLSELPGVTVTPTAGAGAAGAAASRVLTGAGLGHLGGHLELRSFGSPGPAARARAAEHAVRAALRTG
ncbi:hypothetical protein OG914_17475 [Streptomyces sp. NBC_00291]|uniref:hypothetical protein n=1 Tax=Streptomyces sp. NBC_00291 TaxID=2975704 RepID=UPI00225B6C71|nr:hypothetical protein [Streptomyces sp. NBC_00291]MCX5155777.1 hypothetical protein [Streptomyces sp. NBC_00291]